MIEMKGRNGLVKYGSHCTLGLTTEFVVAFYSRRMGFSPPVAFYGQPEELVQLFESIVAEIKTKANRTTVTCDGCGTAVEASSDGKYECLNCGCRT